MVDRTIWINIIIHLRALRLRNVSSDEYEGATETAETEATETESSIVNAQKTPLLTNIYFVLCKVRAQIGIGIMLMK